MEGLIRANGDELLTRQQLFLVATPQGTATHKPIPHIDVVNAMVETLGFRRIGVHAEQYAVSRDGMKLFAVVELEETFNGCRFALGLRTSNDKSIALGITVGYRVMVCANLAFFGGYTPVVKKHTKNFNLQDALTLGVDNIQRNFGSMVKAVQLWKGQQLTDVDARQVIYEAYIEGALQVPRHLARPTHEAYFNPPHEEFQPRTMYSLSNAFTQAFKELDPISLQRATADLGDFLKRYHG
jgi:uncharacterized protein DUF932